MVRVDIMFFTVGKEGVQERLPHHNRSLSSIV